VADDLPLDQPARDTVVNDLDRNLFVEAGAGTGKTTTLVKRIVRLVSSGRLDDVRQLAAITFTEAAAAELRDRIRGALESAADPTAPSELAPEERARCGRAATRIDEAVITTLHGFAQRILAEHPVAAHLPPAFEVDEGIPAELEFVTRWQSFVDSLLADPELTDVLQVGATLDLLLPRLAELARVLKDRWDRLTPADAEVAGAATEPFDVDVLPILADLDALAALVAPRAGGVDKLLELVEGQVLPIRDACIEAAGTGEPLEVLRVLDAMPLPKPRFGKADFWGPGGKDEVYEILDSAREHQVALLTRLRRQVLARLAPELVRFTLGWADERRRSGRLHFHDLLVLARDLLWRDAEVRRSLARRWSVLVVDEFQDTDPLQVELVFALAAADPDHLPARWEDIELGAGRVLVVGDPKQSIYGFRGADITLWNRTRARFGTGVVSLVQNFRSVDTILEWVNEVFLALIGEGQGDVQPSYASLSTSRTSLDAGHAVLFLGDQSTDRAAEVRVREATEIALAIATLRASGHEVIDDVTGACRRMRHDDVAVLVPTRSPIGALERSLDDLDIPYRIESRSLVWRTDAVREVLNILTAIEDPADDVAVVAALRSPAFACSDVDLFRWRRAGGRWDHTRRAPEAIPEGHPVRVAMAQLAEWHAGRHRRSVDGIVEEVIRARRLLELTMAQRRPRDHWRRLRFVVDQARAFVEAGGASLAQFLAWTSLQVDEGATAVETVVPEPDDDAVRILTVHGAKGLEFPVVVLAGLANGRAPAMTDVAWTATGPELMVSAYGGGQERRFATAGWADAKEARADFESAESTRLLYVAATRARDTLIVSLHHPARADRHSLIRTLFPVVAPTRERWSPSVPPAAVPLFTEPRPLARTAEERAAWHRRHEAALAGARRGLAVSPTGLRDDADAATGVHVTDASVGEAHTGVQGALFDDVPPGLEPGEHLLPPGDRPTGVHLTHAPVGEAHTGSPWADEEPDDDAAPAESGPPADGDEPGDGVELVRGGTAMGRAVHAVLEHAPLGGTDPVDPAVVAGLAAEAARAEGADPALVVELATSALRSGALADARAGGRLWREVPIVVPMGDRVLEGYIDLLYERPDGELVVVDWKTDRGRTPEEVDASLEKYRIQGAAYAAALIRATGRKVAEVAFVFCRDGGEPAVERTITDLADAVAEVEALLEG
jgi:ATP-dependent helicase/nuclease subunit A